MGLGVFERTGTFTVIIRLMDYNPLRAVLTCVTIYLLNLSSYLHTLFSLNHLIRCFRAGYYSLRIFLTDFFPQSIGSHATRHPGILSLMCTNVIFLIDCNYSSILVLITDAVPRLPDRDFYACRWFRCHTAIFQLGHTLIQRFIFCK